MKSTALPKDFKAWLNRPTPESKGKRGARKRIRAASPKRAKQLAEYTKQRKSFLGIGTGLYRVCAAQFPDVCTHYATEVHHRASRVGEKLNDKKDWVPICLHCHRHVHAHPSEARKLGLLK